MKTSSLPLNEAVVKALQGYKLPVLTDYALGLVIYRVVKAGAVDEQSLRLKVSEPERRHFNQVLRFLLQLGVAAPIKGLSERSTLTLLGQSHPNPFEVICTVDPFAYISHLSAMEYHGLTDRIPTTLFTTSPPIGEWRNLALERMRKDLGANLQAYIDAGFPSLHRIKLLSIDKRSIHITQRKNAGAYLVTDQGSLRVSSIGRTFLDMLQAPDNCGGIRHVIDVFRTHAQTYKGLILSEIDRHGVTIDKVRAGYILEDMCDIHDPIIDGWQKKFVQRGGSRKLYAGAPYVPQYSERWCISLNQA